MPQVNISYEKAMQFYTTEVGTVLRKLRNGNMGRGKRRESQLKNRKVDPELMTWYLCWDDSLDKIDPQIPLAEMTTQSIESVRKVSLLGQVDDWEGRAAVSMFQSTPEDIVSSIQSRAKSRFDAQQQLDQIPDTVLAQMQALQDAEEFDSKRSAVRRKARNVFMKAFVESGLEAIALSEDGQEFFDELGAALSKEMIRHFNTYTQSN